MSFLQDNLPSEFYKALELKSSTKLTPIEIKYASYIFLGFDNQQLTHLLKADPNTVRKNKYRLKKKLNLSKNDDLKLYKTRIML